MTKQHHTPQSDSQRQAGGQSNPRQQQQSAANTKRLATQIHEQMEVIGADGARVGRVKNVEGDRLNLSGKDWQGSDISGCTLPIDNVQAIENDRIRLNLSAAQAVSMASRG